ncbi:hypothetical protein D6C80_08322 [Aureobasidium pullulans]|nr:hypothetical protein D6C80_08322 [Aureobasidium pullulans]
MTSYLASYIPAIKSIIPQSSPSVAALPEIGDQAPARVGSVDLKSGGGRPTLVAFVRHCGCPFAEKEVQLLGAESRKNEKLHVVIVQHSEEATTQQWFEDIGGKKAFPDSKRYTLVADPERKAYAAWGVGSLGWGGMVNGGVMEALKSLKESDGIDLRPTGVGSYRWQNSGGFAVDSAGTIRWRKIAKDSSDMCGYSEAAKTITEGKASQNQSPTILTSFHSFFHHFATKAIAKAVTPHDILDMLHDILKSFTNHFFFDTVLYSPHARTKEFLSQQQQLLSKMAITSANVPDWQYAINDWQFCHLRDASISRADLFVHTRELIPEDVKFFNSTVNASTAIVRGYAYIYLLTSGSARFSDRED